MPLYSFNQKKPHINPNSWIANNANIIGDVLLGAHSSVWWNAVLRADNAQISVGQNSNIQDGAVLHTDEDIPMSIGDNVTVGHMAMLHGCHIGDGSLIGIGSIILNHASIAPNSLVGANTFIPEGKIFPPGVLIFGSPGKIIRTLSDAEILQIQNSATHYVKQAQAYRSSLQPLT